MGRVLLASLLIIVLAITVIGFVKAQDFQIPTREPVKMAFYQEASGIDAQIEQIKSEVQKAGEAQSFSMKGKDPVSLSRAMAENWAYSNERGQTYLKEKWIAERFDKTDKSLLFPFGQHVDITWHIFGENTMVETGRSNSTLVFKGKVSHGPRRETNVFAKVDGRWVQASLHVAFIPEEQRDFTFPPGSLPEGVTQPDPKSEAPKHQELQMAGYQDARGTNAHIEGIKNDLLKALKERSDAMKRKDLAGALNVMGDPWAYSNERGQTFGREQWVNDFFTANFHTPFAEHVDVDWHVFGDNTVVETGRSNSTLLYKGKVSHGPRRETAVYAKVNGKWVLASLHVAFITAEQKDFTFPAGSLPAD
jgi:hypothetical protein